ncbi:hypothetical protein EC844_12432 [Acinetobacter calcoaceticus]|uniref:Lipoprotein n=1 Tax=Acinetobacter calcoaceticus TaxID=471 RepID=A0A4R1XFZ3_ACICA|nr:hypothetical protein EC844_12432 [Acinetobacter calcoaceticus]
MRIIIGLVLVLGLTGCIETKAEKRERLADIEIKLLKKRDYAKTTQERCDRMLGDFQDTVEENSTNLKRLSEDAKMASYFCDSAKNAQLGITMLEEEIKALSDEIGD